MIVNDDDFLCGTRTLKKKIETDVKNRDRIRTPFFEFSIKVNVKLGNIFTEDDECVIEEEDNTTEMYLFWKNNSIICSNNVIWNDWNKKQHIYISEDKNKCMSILDILDF